MAPYREHAGAEEVVADTAEGRLALAVEPGRVRLAVAARSVEIAGPRAVLVDGGREAGGSGRPRRVELAIAGRLLVARDVPREDVGLWLEEPGGLRRVFGVAPRPLLDEGGLAALAGLDRLAARLRAALAPYAGATRRVVELGRGKDKALLVEEDGRLALHVRRLMQERAELVVEARAGGEVTVHDGDRRARATVRSRHGVTVVGDFVRFAAPDGEDLARARVPWVDPEDRLELARRIGRWLDPAADPTE